MHIGIKRDDWQSHNMSNTAISYHHHHHHDIPCRSLFAEISNNHIELSIVQIGLWTILGSNALL